MSVIVVEGESDRVALEVLAARMGARLPRIIVLGGATGVRRAVQQLAGEYVVGLVDENERPLFEGVVDAVFVCEPDLERELIRALGTEGVEAVIDAEGELDSFRGLQRQPAQRGQPIESQLVRFLAGRSRNKVRYARLLAQALPLDHVPAPLAGVVSAAAGAPRSASDSPLGAGGVPAYAEGTDGEAAMDTHDEHDGPHVPELGESSIPELEEDETIAPRPEEEAANRARAVPDTADHGGEAQR